MSARCGQCAACKIERIGCACDGAFDDGCFACTPDRYMRAPCPPATHALDDLDPRATITDPAVAAVLERVALDAKRAAKAGKTRFELLHLPFMGSMARQLQAGLDANPARVPDGWKDLDPAAWLMAYRAALLRHIVASDTPHTVDESGESHYAGIAVNAMICAYFEQQLAAAAESATDDTQMPLPLGAPTRPFAGSEPEDA